MTLESEKRLSLFIAGVNHSIPHHCAHSAMTLQSDGPFMVLYKPPTRPPKQPNSLDQSLLTSSKNLHTLPDPLHHQQLTLPLLLPLPLHLTSSHEFPAQGSSPPNNHHFIITSRNQQSPPIRIYQVRNRSACPGYKYPTAAKTMSLWKLLLSCQKT